MAIALIRLWVSMNWFSLSGAMGLPCLPNTGIFYSRLVTEERDPVMVFFDWVKWMVRRRLMNLGRLTASEALLSLHQTIWNNLEGQPPEDCEDDDAQDAFDAHYFHTSLVNGAFPICHIGCALREWLVISGPERGNVWYDARPDLAGIHPLKDASGNRLSFLAWYRQWLDEALGQLQK